MIRALVVDDDAANRAYLRTLLAAHPEVTVIGEAEAIAPAHALITTAAPDLLFLDVEMPGGSGFDLLERLGTWPFEVIFCTGFAVPDRMDGILAAHPRHGLLHKPVKTAQLIGEIRDRL